MFTGIIQTVGQVAAVQPQGGDVRLYIKTNQLPMHNVALGDSIATNGVCLTAVELPGDGFWADVSRETLGSATIGDLSVGARVNLEKAMTPQTHFGGHIVSGHVDGVGKVLSRSAYGRSERFVIEAPKSLAKYIAAKGSITVDGASLTVNHVNGAQFDLNIVPHTVQETIIAQYAVGTAVNLEVDIIARYLERLLMGEQAHESSDNMAGSSASGVTLERLMAAGMVKS